MDGLMQQVPLTVGGILRRAEQLFGDKEIATAGPGGIQRTTYRAWAERTRRLGGALDDLGISADGRVATFAWNTARHLELYFAAPASGRVLHTLNIRLFADQLVYIANHAEDEVVFADRSLLPVLWPLVDRLTSVRHVVVMDDGSPAEIPEDPRVLDYEALLAQASPSPLDQVTDEQRAASMCYTSGTTGNPKGVVYSHRSTVLHSLVALTVDGLGIGEADRVLPVVPMFHANAWGLCHAAVLAGASLVFPGADLSPAAIADLLVGERVTVAAAVPTIWMGVRPLLAGRDTSALRSILCGGSAVPKALAEAYRTELGVPILQAWGMTETSPLATIARVRSDLRHLPEDAQADIRATQGLPVVGMELRIADPDTGETLPWDGKTCGEIQVRSPWVAAAYYNDPRSAESFTADGWLRTGDVATVSPEGYVHLVDRTKDLIKSGGEWISSVDLENEIMAHPKVAEAAVIAVPSERWMERPLACVVVKPGEQLDPEELRRWLADRVPKWWLPDRVELIDEVPKTSVGKFSKRQLRERFADLRLP
ncbi:long-chain fatty acid--CoA ligase [Aciditerrimonas ferrireducens]|uniref:Long-chain fatty acid--CoA ligase n=1 Tax=Aciditerrimonas ferrireducens TaxID=667306 RepID=A0ABV6C2R4_9ACTN